MQVIVQGLPFAYAWQDLKDLFKPFGGLLQADLVMGQDGRSRGWGTVNFETQEDAEKAIKVHILFVLNLCHVVACSVAEFPPGSDGAHHHYVS